MVHGYRRERINETVMGLAAILKALSAFSEVRDLYSLVPPNAVAEAISETAVFYTRESEPVENVDQYLIALVGSNLITNLPATYGLNQDQIPSSWIEVFWDEGFDWTSRTQGDQKVRSIIKTFLDALHPRVFKSRDGEQHSTDILLLELDQIKGLLQGDVRMSTAQVPPLPLGVTPMPEPMAELWKQARRCLERHEIPEASQAVRLLERYQKTLHITSDEVHAAVDALKGIIAHMEDDIVSAGKYLHLACARDSKNLDWRLWAYRLRYAEGESVPQLLDEAKIELARETQWQGLKHFMAALYLVNGDIDKAIALMGADNGRLMTAEEHKFYAAYYARIDNSRKALRHARRSLILSPDDPEAHFNFAEVLRWRIGPIRPQTARVWQRWALQQSQRHYHIAATLYQAPSDKRMQSNALVGQAVCLRDTGRTHEAVRLFRQVAETDKSESALWHVEFATALMRNQQWSDAPEWWARGIGTLPSAQHSTGYVQWAQCLFNIQDYDGAADLVKDVVFHELSRIDGFVYKLIRLYGHLSREADNPRGIEVLLNDLVMMYPVEAREFVGDVYMRLHQWGDAVTAFMEYSATNPDHVPTHIGLAFAYAHLQEFARALHEVETVFSMLPDNDSRLRPLLNVAIGSAEPLKEFGVVVHWTTKLMTYDDCPHEAWLSRGMAHMQLQNWSEAAPDLAKHMQLTGTFDSLQPLVAALCYLGNYTEAVQWTRRAELRGPHRFKAQQLRAQVYMFQGRMAEAIQLADSMCKVYPTESSAQDFYGYITQTSGAFG